MKNAARAGAGASSRIRGSILEAIGRTPLVRLNRLTRELGVEICVKVESLNPGGSVKDRIGLAMIEDAERRGLLSPGGTIIEATAGNTGVGLALVAAVKGYRCIFVMPDKMSEDKVNLLKAYGAEVVITPTSVPPDSPRATTAWPTGWRARSRAPSGPTSSPTRATPRPTTAPPARRSGRTPRASWTCSWPAWAPAAPSPAPAATSRSRTRTSWSSAPTRRARSCPATRPQAYKVEGIGEDFVPAPSTARWWTRWSGSATPESFRMARRLAREEGLLVGGSAGTAVAAARQVRPAAASRAR